MKMCVSGTVLLTALLVLSGCKGPQIELGPNTAGVNGLVVQIDPSNTIVVKGETLKVVVVGRNTTREPIRIDARTGAPVYVRIWRYTGLAWETVKRYPEVATMVMTPWTLAPHSERWFELNLTVGPDWPTNEPLRLTAQLNGRTDVVPHVDIMVLARPAEAE
jgi:hypothetical protein